MRTILVACLTATYVVAGAQAGCRGGVVHLKVSADGTVFWNDVAFKTRQQMVNKFEQAAHLQEQPEIHLGPMPSTDYKALAAVLTEAQKAGLHCLGFTGLDQGTQD